MQETSSSAAATITSWVGRARRELADPVCVGAETVPEREVDPGVGDAAAGFDATEKVELPREEGAVWVVVVVAAELVADAEMGAEPNSWAEANVWQLEEAGAVGV
jgi:hypothetical protein